MTRSATGNTLMFQRIQQYDLIDAGGTWYRPRAYGDPQPDGTWDGWVVFFPVASRTAISPSAPETTQSTLAALTAWAAGLTPVYLEGALDRALRIEPPSLVDRLTEAEYEALDDAERLEREADIERGAARLDETAARTARADAERIRRERLAAEAALAGTEEAAAKSEAERHEQAARDARAAAAAAARRRRSAETAGAPTERTKTRSDKKK
jgi:colicin import membrane protein